MLKRYSSAIDKIRRIDVLKEELRVLKGEDGKLSSSAVVYRKKNDWREKEGNDGAIAKINDRRAAVSKREALIKAEIKSLRAEVYDLLSVCFVEAKTEEHRAKIREACLYASDGNAMISQTGYTPSAFGKCRIAGSRATRDPSLGGTVETVIRAGIKNKTGRFIVLPEIVVYKFDDSVAEGEYTVLNELYRCGDFERESKSVDDFVYTPSEFTPVTEETTEIEDSASGFEVETPVLQETPLERPVDKRSEKSFAVSSIKNKFGGLRSLAALAFALVWAGFYFAAALTGVAASAFGDKILVCAVAYLAYSVIRLCALRVSREKYCDDGVFALFSLYGGALSAFTLAWSYAPEKSFALPLAMFLSGIILLAASPSETGTHGNDGLGLVSYLAAGVALALIIYSVYACAEYGVFPDVDELKSARKIWALVALCGVAASGVAAAICAYFKRELKSVKLSLCGFSAFFVVSAFCCENCWGFMLLLAVIFALVFVFIKEKNV